MAEFKLPPPHPPIHPKRVRIETIGAGAALLRVYDPKSRHPSGPRLFRKHGPHARFDHHRGTKVRKHLEPSDDPDRGIYYAASELSCAVVEVFGTTGVIDRSFVLVRSVLQDDLHLLDLRGDAAIRAGTIHAIGQIESRRKTWAWSRYFYESPAIYGSVHGVIYASARNGKDAVALYERAQGAVDRSNQSVLPLSDPTLELDLLRIADATGFLFV